MNNIIYIYNIIIFEDGLDNIYEEERVNEREEKGLTERVDINI